MTHPPWDTVLTYLIKLIYNQGRKMVNKIVKQDILNFEFQPDPSWHKNRLVYLSCHRQRRELPVSPDHNI